MEKEVKEIKGSLDLKESLEMLSGISLILGTVESVLEDGKINLADAPKALELLKSYNKIIEAAKGVKLIPAELKDLDQTEMVQLASALFPLLKQLKNIVLLAKKMGKK
jgi:hypothetical protein